MRVTVLTMANQSLNPSDSDPDQLAKFKSHVKAWLQHYKLSIVWLAYELGYAPGSVKNWFYGKVPIPEEKQRTIRQIMRNYEVVQLQREARARVRTSANPLIGVIPIDLTHEDVPTPAFKLWGLAADIPSSFFDLPKKGRNTSTSHRGEGSKDDSKFSNWAVETLMDAAATKIQAEIDKIKESPSENHDDSLLRLLQEYTLDDGGNPAEIPWANPGYGRFCPHMKEENDRECVYIPVLYSKWKGIYAELAAAISGQSTHAWIISTLNEAAPSASVRNLQCFLDQYTKPSE